MPKKTPFKSMLNRHEGRDFLIYCPGKNIDEWHDRVNRFIKKNQLITIGSNKITQLFVPDYHIFTNNDKYQHYGHQVAKTSKLVIGRYIKPAFIKKHNPPEYIFVDYTDRDPEEKPSYDAAKDIVRGYYRTSGNLAIMLSHLMGARTIYVAGMSGFTFQFDGDIHYYKAELKKSDMKTRDEWWTGYDEPVIRCLAYLRGMGINFKLITPTIYKDYYDSSVLKQ